MKSCCWWVEEVVVVLYWFRLMNQCELHFICSQQPADVQWIWVPLGPLACACFVIRSRCRPDNKHLVQWSGSHEAHSTFKPLRTTELWSAPPSAVVWTSASPPSWQSEIRESSPHCLLFLSAPLETTGFFAAWHVLTGCRSAFTWCLTCRRQAALFLQQHSHTRPYEGLHRSREIQQNNTENVFKRA